MKPRRRFLRLALSFAIVVAALAAVGSGNVLAFNRDAARLQTQIAGYEAAGVPASDFAGAQGSLTAWQRDVAAGIPASALSGAAWNDPLLRQRAEAEARWSAWHDSQVAAQIDSSLERASGGLQDGRPADIATLSATLDKTVAAAKTAKVDLEPGATAQDDVAGYWLLPHSTQLAYHDTLKQAVGDMLGVLQSRLAAKQRARTLLDQAQTLLGEAQWLGSATAADASATDAEAAAVDAAHTDAQLAAVLPPLETLIGKLAQEAGAEPSQPPLPTGPCLTNVPEQLIQIHLVTQELVAYENGCPILATWVTTGMPELRTVRGTFHIFYKARWFLMQSPWPYSSPFWYPNTWVGYAMEFFNDGTFIHTADWEPPSAYGPGSENGGYASHGCVHVEDGPAATLFGWAKLGTEVIVGD